MSKARDIADLDFNSPDIDGGNIDGATIGATTPGLGRFSYVKATTNFPSETDSAAYLDYISGGARITSKGADGSTKGTFTVLQQANDGNPANTALSIDSSSNAVFGGNIGVSSYIDYGTVSNRGKVGFDSNNVYIGSTSSTGSIIFKNNIGSGDAPHSSGDTLFTIADAGAATFVGDILVDSSNAEINLKSGITGTTGAINWTFNTDVTDYASIKLPYDTRSTTGLHIDSGYPITIDAASGTGIKFLANGIQNQFSSSNNIFNETGANVDFRVETTASTHTFYITGSGGVGINQSNPSYGMDVNTSFRALSSAPGHSTTTGTAASGNFFKLGTVSNLSGSRSLKIRVCGTVSYSAGANISGETTILFRGSNAATTIEGTFWHEGQGNSHISAVGWKNTGTNDQYEIYVDFASSFAGVDTFVETSGQWAFGVTDTGSNSTPSGVTLISPRKVTHLGTVAVSEETTTETTFNPNGVDLDFRVEATSYTHALFVDSSTSRVGIFSSTPTVPFDVNYSSGAFGLPPTSGSTPDGFMRIGYNDRSWGGNEMLFGIINASANGYAGYIQNKAPTDYTVNRPFLINPQGGNVAIGTDTATYALNIHHATPRIQLKDTSSSAQAYLELDGTTLKLANTATNGPLKLVTNNPREEFVYINGTAFYSESFNLTNNIQYDFDIDVPSEGGFGNSFFVIAGYNHYHGTAYGAHRVAFVSSRATNLQSMINLGNHTSTGGGEWQISKPNNTTLRIRKTAGTYVGSGSGFITVFFRNAVG